jgi:hypothetical protein
VAGGWEEEGGGYGYGNTDEDLAMSIASVERCVYATTTVNPA